MVVYMNYKKIYVASPEDIIKRYQEKINKLREENKKLQDQLSNEDIDPDRILVLRTKRDKNKLEIDKIQKQINDMK